MLDIGFSELLLIAVVALVVIGPKDLPVVVRHVSKFMRELRMFYLGAKKQMTDLLDESGVNDIKREMTTIIDLEGKPQQAFDVSDLDSLKATSSGEAGHVPPPAGGRLGGGYSEAPSSPNSAPPQPSPYRGGSTAVAPHSTASVSEDVATKVKP